MAKKRKLAEFTSSLFGKIKPDHTQIYEATSGLFGFGDLKQFLLFSPPEIEPLKCLQSIENPGVVFALLDPDYFLPDYRAEVSEEEVKELEIKSLDEVREFVIVTIPPKKPNKMTANLLAPIIVNFRNRKLKQVILKKPEYQIRHPIINSVRKRPKRSFDR